MSANTSLSLTASPSFGSAGPSGSPAPGGPGGASPKGPKPVSPDKATRLWRNLHYPQEIWWAIACFIAVIAVFQFASWALAKYRSRRGVKSTSAAEAEAGGAPAAVRRFAWRNVPSAVINAWRVAAFRCTLNIGQSYTLNLAEVFVTCAYIIALFTWEFINTTNPTTGKKWDPLYTGNRAGVIGSSQLPLVTALGMKNNVISYITGISYDKLNYIHRMTARVVFVMLWLHGGLRFVTLDPGELEEGWLRLGIMSMAAFSLLVLISIRPLRAQTYEIFYFTHFATVLIMLLGGYFHAAEFHLGKWIWPSFVIWGFDRALRFARVVYYNHLYFGFHKTAHRLDASVELLSPHFVRLHIERPPHFHWTPGQTAFLVMPTVSAFPLEAHPFTIASVDSHYQLEGVKSPVSETDQEKAVALAGHDAAPFWKELVFLVNVREGFTKRLATCAAKGEKVKVLIDGPYGFSPSLDADDTVVLVAGGSGVSFTLSTFLGVLSHVQHGKSRCRKIVFIWSIRDASHIEWVSKALSKALELAPPEVEVSIRIFVTGKASAAAAEADARQWNEDDSVHSSEGSASHKEGKAHTPSLLSYPAVAVAQGRPDLPALLREEVDTNAGRMSVTVCGSQGIARACRAALRVPLSNALTGGPSVVLHVESFGYA